MFPKINTTMHAVRDSHHACIIGRQVAMFRLIMLGLSAENADRFLRSLPMKTQPIAAAHRCQWHAYCDHPASTTIPHPTLGDVPACGRCADKVARIEKETVR